MKLTGRIVKGNQIGRTIGFPTANIELIKPAVIKKGVYGVYVTHRQHLYAGVMNIGTCPTVHEEAAQTIEVHILDFCEDVYGETLDVAVSFFMRHEQKFPSLSALVTQLHEDVALAKSRLTFQRVGGM